MSIFHRIVSVSDRNLTTRADVLVRSANFPKVKEKEKEYEANRREWALTKLSEIYREQMLVESNDLHPAVLIYC